MKAAQTMACVAAGLVVASVAASALGFYVVIFRDPFEYGDGDFWEVEEGEILS